jgi:tetratricopeptide (TPR) repeat protein
MMLRPAWRAAPLVLALVTAVVFTPVLHAGFVDWDDPINFLENPYYRGLGWPQLRWMLTASVMGHWIPVTWLTLGADFAVWGMNPFGYHLTSLLLHAASAALFYLVARRLLGLAIPSAEPGTVNLGAVVAALYFALHPLRVESVAWITERRDLTSGLFFLLTVLAYLKAHERTAEVRTGWRWVSLTAAALALASKSIVMGLPLALLILDVYPLKRLGPRFRDWWSAQAWPVWREKIPFTVLAVAAAATAYLVQRNTGYLTPADPAGRIGMVAYNVWFHVWKTVVPLNLGPIYELPPRVNPLDLPYLLSAAAGLAITVALWLRRRRWPAGLAIWTFYLVMLAPVAGLVHTGNHLGADRNTYIPCLGFALLVGALAMSVALARRRGVLRTPIAAVALGVVAVWIGGLALTTRAQSSVWHDSETLWRYAIEVDPGCAICLHNLGVSLGRRGEFTEAQALLERAIALRPDQSEFHGNYGPLLIQMGRRSDGITRLRYRLERNPRDVNARVNLGIALVEDGRPAEAVAELEQALRVRPDSVPALTSLGRALLADDRAEPARGAFERALAIDPASPFAHLGLARAHLARGDRAAAREQIPVLARLDPQLARLLEQEMR